MDGNIAAIQQKMWENDYFTQWLGIDITHLSIGSCSAKFSIRQEMLNGHGSVHGGVLFSAADSVFAFACNTAGLVTVALDAKINFIAPGYVGQVIYVNAKAIHQGRKTGVYEVRLTDENDKLICLFHGTSYTTNKPILDQLEEF